MTRDMKTRLLIGLFEIVRKTAARKNRIDSSLTCFIKDPKTLEK